MAATMSKTHIVKKSKILSGHMTETYNSSVKFMKELTAVAISTITYFRKLSPDASFRSENYAGLELYILKETCKDELGQFLHKSLRSAYDAFDRKYLRKLAVCFYAGECDSENMIECHTFEYKYDMNSGIKWNVYSKDKENTGQSVQLAYDAVRQQTTKMIKNCMVILTSRGPTLPPDCNVYIRLYYNEDAPNGYQAPGFNQSLNTEHHLRRFHKNTIKIKTVKTPFHQLSMHSYAENDTRKSEKSITADGMTSVFNQDERNERSDTSSSEIQCPCGNLDSEDLYKGALLKCNYCGRKQHAICLGIMDSSAVSNHCCTVCYDQDPNRMIVDTELASIPEEKRRDFCVIRRALEWCTHLSTINGRSLANRFKMSKKDAFTILNVLDSYGIIKGDGNFDMDTPKAIITEQLKSTIKCFFYVDEKEDLVDRLVAETLTLRSQQNSLEEVLNLTEEETLLNPFKIGKVIEDTELNKEPIMENPIMKEYRDVLLSNEKEEENLSLEIFKEQLKKDDKHNAKKRRAKDPGNESRKCLRFDEKNKKTIRIPNNK